MAVYFCVFCIKNVSRPFFNAAIHVSITIVLLVLRKSSVRVVVVLPFACKNKAIVSGVVRHMDTVCMLLVFLQTLKPSSSKQKYNKKDDKYQCYYSCNTCTSNCGFISNRFKKTCLSSRNEIACCIISGRCNLIGKSFLACP